MLYEESFRSVNGRDDVQYWIYVPAAEPAGVIQLIHGFGEHSRRYLHMIEAFVDAGFIVAADDHVGHGKTAVVNNTWGDWGRAGYETMVKDEKQLHDLTEARFPDLPYLMFGHSMGSVITRQYMARFGSDLKAAALCGTCGNFPTDAARSILQKLVEEGRGSECDPNAGAALMGWMLDRCGKPEIGNEWICHDRYVQMDHAKDPFDAFTRPTTNESLLDFILMIDDVKGTGWAGKVPTALPVYSVGGDHDPFGTYASGLYECSNWLIETGHIVETRVYGGRRHEVHNYPDIRDDVEIGIITFFRQKIG